MIIAKENIYYQNRMFKPKEPLPCYDMKMVQAWLSSGVAIDTESKEQKKPAPTNSNKVNVAESKETDIKNQNVNLEVKNTKIKTRSSKK